MTKCTNWEDTKLRGEKQQQSDPCEENKKSKDKKCQRKENKDVWCFNHLPFAHEQGSTIAY